jgi:pimeloyl-ACP methyl ester carboxylesterase
VRAADLDVEHLGAGPPVLLVHGSIVGARRTWRAQRVLAERWALCIPNRPGFAGSPPLARNDFAVEAPMVAELLGDGMHLVGHSYGAVIALLAAALAPEAVRSLTVSEPGTMRVAADVPAVAAAMAHGDRLYDGAAAGAIAPAAFLRFFREGVGSTHETPPELPAELEHGARLAMAERRPWEAEVPIGALAAAPFPKLVISGGHSPVFDAICDVLAAGIGARREVVRGRGHTIPSTGEAYNAVLEAFLREAEAGGRG